MLIIIIRTSTEYIKQWRYGYYFRIAIVFSVDNKFGGADSTAMTTGEWLQMWDESMAGTGKKRREQPVAAIPKLNDSDSFWKFRKRISLRTN